jgi:hypothetical protein
MQGMTLPRYRSCHGTAEEPALHDYVLPQKKSFLEYPHTIFFSNTILCSIFAIDLVIVLCSQLCLDVFIVSDDTLVEVIHDNRSISCHKLSIFFNGTHLQQEPINLHYLQACNGSTIKSITLNVGLLISN